MTKKSASPPLESDTRPKHAVSHEAKGRLHVPVMLEEAMLYLEPRRGGLFIDATFGMGGHTSSILQHPKTTVIGIDRDASVLKKALETNQALRETATKTDRLQLFHGRFSLMTQLLSDYQGRVDGILMDIGVSSVQLDTAERGFSYRQELDSALDMRMDQSAPGPTAYDIVNTWSESRLSDLIWRYGEDRRASTIANVIVENRKRKPIQSTYELAQLISSSIPRGSSAYMSLPERIAEHSKRTFQALRIEVNQELDELRLGLHAAEHLLRPGGRLVVISFHSLEDRIVKNFFNFTSGKPQESRLHPDLLEALRKRDAQMSSKHPNQQYPKLPTFDTTIQKVAKATEAELDANKRARPAKLRAATRTSAPPHDWSTTSCDL